MAPILYWMELSPPARAVVLTARALNIELEFKEIDLTKGEHRTPEFLKINPQHTIPVLDDNGFIIWESPAIAAYLIGKYGKDDSLYPKDLKKRAMVDQKLHFTTGVLFQRLRNMFAPLFFKGKTEIPQDKIDDTIAAYEFMEAFLKDSTWLAGDQITIADFCAIATISSIAPIVPIDAKKLPKLTAWFNRCKTLPYYDANAKGAEQLSESVKKILKK